MFEFLGLADWIIWYFIVQYVVIGVVIVYLLYTTRFKIGFKAVFLRKAESLKHGESYSFVEDKDKQMVGVEFEPERVGDYIFVGEKDFRASDKVISFRGSSFIPDLGSLAYRKFGYHFLFFDFDSGSLLTFGGEVRGVEPRFAQRQLKSGVFERILMAVSNMARIYWVLLIVTAVFCAVAFFLGGYLYGSGFLGGNHT